MRRRPAAALEVRRPAADTRRRKLTEVSPRANKWNLIAEPLPDNFLQIGKKFHVKGSHNQGSAEMIGECREITQDAEGEFFRVLVTGTTSSTLRSNLREKVRMGSLAEIYVPLKTTPEAEQSDPNLFYATMIREGAGEVEWKSNMLAEEPPFPPLPGQGLSGNLATAQLQEAADQAVKAAQKEGAPVDEPKKKKGRKRRWKELLEVSHMKIAGGLLDPTTHLPKAPHKGKKRARSKKKKKKEETRESSSPGSMTSESSSMSTDSLFGEVAITAVKEVTRQLADRGGDAPNLKNPVPAQLFTKYWKQELADKVSGRSLKRELANLTAIADCLCQGEGVQALDICVQRLKSIQLLLQGASMEVATKLEIPISEHESLATQGEIRKAAAEFRDGRKVEAAASGKGKNKPSSTVSGWATPPYETKGKSKNKDKDSKGKSKQSRMVRPEGRGPDVAS